MMSTVFRESIVALSSGRLPSAVAVVRMSGPQVRFALETIAGGVPEPRSATVRSLRFDGAELDRGLVVFFPSPASFTGEDVVEFNLHGGKATVSALLAALTRLPSVRLAEPGEFTRRAFLNGKMDLLEAEAVSDLVNAETEAQRRLALLNHGGAQSALYGGWRKRLLDVRAMLEAELDFSDEGDVPGSVSVLVWEDVRRLAAEMKIHVGGFQRAAMIREGFDVVIMGAPNVGKSSLLNALAMRDVAIVSDEPGTTRDLVEVVLDLGGNKVRLTDTAGIREQAGHVERMGIDRAVARARSADLILLLDDGRNAAMDSVELGNTPILHVRSKADLSDMRVSRRFDLLLSAVTGAGLVELLDELARRSGAALQFVGDALPSRLRHVELLNAARGHIERAVLGLDLDLQAEELRLAQQQLGKISGAVGVEDVLGVIFSQFCIGK